MPLVGLQCVIVVFPDHAHFLDLKFEKGQQVIVKNLNHTHKFKIDGRCYCLIMLSVISYLVHRH